MAATAAYTEERTARRWGFQVWLGAVALGFAVGWVGVAFVPDRHRETLRMLPVLERYDSLRAGKSVDFIREVHKDKRLPSSSSEIIGGRLDERRPMAFSDPRRVRRGDGSVRADLSRSARGRAKAIRFDDRCGAKVDRAQPRSLRETHLARTVRNAVNSRATSTNSRKPTPRNTRNSKPRWAACSLGGDVPRRRENEVRKGMPSERIEILKSQLAGSRDEERKIAVQVRRADEESRKGMVGVPPEQREGQLKAKIEDKINARGSSDERALLRLAKSQIGSSPLDVGIIYACLSGPTAMKGSPKAQRKGPGGRRVERR